MSEVRGGIVLSMPYAEASGRILAGEVHTRSGRVLVPLGGNMGRRRVTASETETVGVAPKFVELARGALRRCHAPQVLNTNAMYLAQRTFDRAVAHHVQGMFFSTVVGYPGASMFTFQSITANVRVLNMVNGTPSAHNAALAPLELPWWHQELIPGRVAKRVRAECSMADLILTPSYVAESQLLADGIPRHKLLVAPYGAARSQISPGRAPGDRLHILYVGQISYRKGVDTLLEIARRMPSAQITIVGPQVVRKLVRNLPPNCHYQGEATEANVQRLMGSAHVLVVPSREDSFGLVVTEALSNGLPVVVSNHAGSSEIIPPGTGIVVSGLDADSYVDALTTLTVNNWDQWSRAVGLLQASGAIELPSWHDWQRNIWNAIDKLACTE